MAASCALAVALAPWPCPWSPCSTAEIELHRVWHLYSILRNIADLRERLWLFSGMNSSSDKDPPSAILVFRAVAFQATDAVIYSPLVTYYVIG